MVVESILKMINKTLIQTSVNKPTQDHINNLMKMAPGWSYVHFDDIEILEFFKKNPIKGFESIEKKFRTIRRGEHRADLFRYYYIYINGGMFVDFDFDLFYNINDVVQNYDFVISTIDNSDLSVLNDTKRARAFNGYMYAKKQSPIIYQALQHLYYLDINELGPADASWDSRYHIVCEFLYHLVTSYPEKSKIKIYKHTDTKKGSFVLNNDVVLGQHARAGKDIMKYTDPLKKIKLPISPPKKEPILFYCETTSKCDFNSGIQRYVRNLSAALINSGVNLIPVTLEHGELTILDNFGLSTMAKYGGPKENSWCLGELQTTSDQIIDFAKKIIYPELPINMSTSNLKEIMSACKANNLKVISVFHDAVTIILKDIYGELAANLFMKYMEDLSSSDIIVSVSNSSNNDYNLIIKNPENKKLKTITLPIPNQINVRQVPSIKDNNSKNIEILCVSTFDLRKNQMSLLKAFGHAKKISRESGYNLNLTLIAAYKGPKGLMNQIYQYAKKYNVEVIVDASDEVIKQKYLKADFTVYPSLYEGYGIPIVESLSHNTPVLCSNTSSMIELAQNLGGIETFDPKNLKQMASSILSMSTNYNKRMSLAKEIGQIKGSTWKDFVDEFLKITDL